MKTYEQMAHDALKRIDEYEGRKLERKKTVTRIAVPAMSFCLVALIGLGMWKSGLLKKQSVPIVDANEPGTQTESTDSKDGTDIGLVQPSGPQQEETDSNPAETNSTNEEVNFETVFPQQTQEEPEPGVDEHGVNQPVGGDPVVTTPAYQLIEDYTNAPDASYKIGRAHV